MVAVDEVLTHCENVVDELHSKDPGEHELAVAEEEGAEDVAEPVAEPDDSAVVVVVVGDEEEEEEVRVIKVVGTVDEISVVVDTVAEESGLVDDVAAAELLEVNVVMLPVTVSIGPVESVVVGTLSVEETEEEEVVK